MQTTTKYIALDLINLVFHPSPEWYDSNPLAGNLKKYQTMNIGYSQAINSVAHAIHVNNGEIKNVENLRLLDVTIDSKFIFTDHISTICEKASQRIGVLMRLRKLSYYYSNQQVYCTLRIAIWSSIFLDLVMCKN